MVFNIEFYGTPPSTAEILFGQAYKRLQDKYPVKFRRSDMVITTKIFFGPNDKVTFFDWNTFGQNEFGLSRKHLMEGIDASLKRMQLKYVDVVYAHRFEDLTPMKEIVEGFTDIIKSGKAFYWGTSQWPAHKIIEAYWTAKKFNLIPPVVEQPKYSMLERKYLEGEYLSVFNRRYNIATTSMMDICIIIKYVIQCTRTYIIFSLGCIRFRNINRKTFKRCCQRIKNG